MAGRAAEWGTKLAELRKATGLSAARVVKQLKELGVDLDPATIYTYEAGRVAAPAAAVVWGLARIYGVKLEDLINPLLDVGSTPRLVSANRSVSLRPSGQELEVLQRLRQLNPTARKACLEYIGFQLEQSRLKKTHKRDKAARQSVAQRAVSSKPPSR